ncbi:MAG: GIY-YIG nuclease family protein [Candidatus Levybacteria bacterium]|nr:GIY-YIG nuclease family protein [Candidatus Levybacteria bacterium]
MSFFIYILRSSSNQLYIGQTNNFENRTKQHIAKDCKAAKFTKDHEDFKPVYKEEYPTRLEAMRREAQIKKWSRAKKEALIAGNLKELKNLSKKK